MPQKLKKEIRQLLDSIQGALSKVLWDDPNLVGTGEFFDWVRTERVTLHRLGLAVDSMSLPELRVTAMFVALETSIFWKIKLFILERLYLDVCYFDARDGPPIVKSFEVLTQMFDPEARKYPPYQLVFEKIVILKKNLERGFQRIITPWGVRRLVIPVDASDWPDEAILREVYEVPKSSTEVN